MDCRELFSRTDHAVRFTGDLHHCGAQVFALYENGSPEKRLHVIDTLLKSVDIRQQTTRYKIRYVFVVAEFLKCRLNKGEFHSHTVRPVDGPLDDELLQQMDNLFVLLKSCPDGHEDREDEIYGACQNLFHEYLALGLDEYCDTQKPQWPDESPPKVQNLEKPYVEVTGKIAARVDLAGGWTDTPPLTLQVPNGVVNLSINVVRRKVAQKPISCTIRKTYRSQRECFTIINKQEPDEIAECFTVQEILDRSTDPKRFGSLTCASFRALGCFENRKTLREVFDVMFPNEKVTGVRVYISSDLPKGSGLGVSSLISACILSTFAHIANLDWDPQKIVAAVLKAERILTTGGGWQDQVGGLYPGLKYSSFTGREVAVRNIPLSQEFHDEIERKLVLVYTGQTRLAADVLHKVVNKFIGGNASFLKDIQDLAMDAKEAYDRLTESEFPIQPCSRYNNLKGRMAFNALPVDVENLFETLQHKQIIETAWMCGAGGGGFACVWLTDALDSRRKIDYEVYHWNTDADVFSIKIDNNPFEITVANEEMPEVKFVESYSGRVKRKGVFDAKSREIKSVDNFESAHKAIGIFASLASVFLPQGYPYTVTDDYITYQIWDTVQAFASSITGALATEAVLKGVGVGSENASLLAAIITWLLKDGAGLIGRIAFAYFKGSRLDIDCKKWRLMADILNDVAFFVDLLAPYFNISFMLFAITSSLLRSFVGVAGGATRAAIIQHQARRHNLADVAAKDGSQETLVNLAALLCSLVLLPAVHGQMTIVWCCFVALTALHLFANYMAVRSLHFDILNERTLAISVRQYHRENAVPSVSEANYVEPLFTNVTGKRHFGCQLTSAMPSSGSNDMFFFRYHKPTDEGWISISSNTTQEDQIRFAFDLEWFALTNSHATDDEFNSFSKMMKSNKWRLDINHLGFDEWRFDVKE